MKVLWKITLNDWECVYRENDTITRPFDLSRFDCEEPKQLRAMSSEQFHWDNWLWDKWNMWDTVVNPYFVVKSQIIRVEEDKD